MKNSVLEVAEGIQEQSADEIIPYEITTTNWIASPTNTSVVAYDESNNDANVTTVVFPTNSPSEAGDVITLSPLKSLTAGHTYRIEVKFVVGSATYECFFRVRCDY